MREAEAARVSEAEAHERREVTLLSENEMLKQRAAALQDTVGRLEMARLRAEAGTSEAVAQHHPAIAAAPAARAPRPAETVWGARSAAAQHQQQSLHLSPREGATPSGHDSHNSRRVKVQPTPRTQPTVGMVHTMQGNVIHVRAPNNMRQGGGVVVVEAAATARISREVAWPSRNGRARAITRRRLQRPPLPRLRRPPRGIIAFTPHRIARRH